jgi:hypothetical protein
MTRATRSPTDWTIGDIARLLAPFGLAVAVGLVVRYLYPSFWWFHEQFLMLGDALMVGGIVGVCIEIWAASTLVGHVAQRLSDILVGHGLPKAAQHAIQKIVKTALVLREYRKSYHIEPCPENRSQLTISITTTYKAVNNGGSPVDYAPTFAEEEMYQPEVQSLQYGQRVLKKDELNFTKEPSGVHSWRPPGKVRLSPSDPDAATEGLDDSQVCCVRWTHRIIVPWNYTEVTAFGALTINPEIILESKPDRLEFHSGGGDDCQHAAGSQTWLFRQAFVTGQHVRVYWWPTESDVSILGAAGNSECGTVF